MREGPDTLSLRRKWRNKEEKRKVGVVGQRSESNQSRADDSLRGGEIQRELQWQSKGITRLL